MSHGEDSADRPFMWRVRDQLCEHVLALPGMSAPKRRDLVIGQVVQDFPGLYSVLRHDTPHADILEFITAAYDYQGALRRLLEVLSSLYRSDSRLGPVRRIVAGLEPEDPLNHGERQALNEQLNSVDPAVIAGAFHYATRTTVAEAGFDLSDVTSIVARAESFPASAGRLPPLFDFVDYIAHRCPRATRATLHDWMDEVSRRLGHADRAGVDAICRATENRLVLHGRYFLVTEVCPDRDAPDRFLVAAWRQHEDDPEEMHYQADRSVPWDEAINTIHDLMQELAWVVEHTARERILELIVPRRLVTQSIDQWMVDPVLPSPIGTIYPLVLRSLDRLTDPAVHGDWGRNWAWLKEHGPSVGVGALREVDSHDPDSVQALRTALLREGAPAGVLMLRSLPDSDQLIPDAYTAGIRGGAPVMIWSRDDATAADLANWIRDVDDLNLLDLPHRVFQLRLHALEEPKTAPAGTQVALIYDDHDRIPEKFRSRSRLRSPQQRKRNWR